MFDADTERFVFVLYFSISCKPIISYLSFLMYTYKKTFIQLIEEEATQVKLRLCLSV